MAEYVAVCGGVNIDIGGRSKLPLIPEDSNPGIIFDSLGGVGRNIAHNLALLGADVRLITALGADDGARCVRESCSALGIDLSGSLVVPDSATSRYLYICDSDGDVSLALSDMSIYERLTPDFFASRLDLLNRAALVVLDANLPADTLTFLSTHCTAPLFADPVSVAKAPRLRHALGRLHTLKPNRAEAEALTGIAIPDVQSAFLAADRLLAEGLQRAYITLGPDGVLAAEGKQRIRLSAPPRSVVNASGCGDAFTAALVWAALRGKDLLVSARCGLAAASLTMSSRESVYPALSEAYILSEMERF